MPAQVFSCLRQAKADARLDLTYIRAGAAPRQASILLGCAYSNRRSRQVVLLGLFADIPTRWTGLLLGCYVVLVRPRDPLAWLMFLLMASFGQLATGVGQVTEGWEQPWRSLGSFYRVMANLSWPVWMLLFGRYFPDPRSRVRLWQGSRWVVAAPIFVFALFVGALEAMEQAGWTGPQ